MSLYKTIKNYRKVDYIYLDEFDSNGKSNRINLDSEDNDISTPVSTAMTNEINSIFPEFKNLGLTRPYWFNRNTDLHFTKDCTVDIVFMDEGAGYRNSFGYYVYDSTVGLESNRDINEHVVMFPNASRSGGGGTMNAGDTVRLASEYTTSVNNGKTYVNATSFTFKKGQSLGLFIVANGWNGNGVHTRKDRYYSTSELNPEYFEQDEDKTLAYHAINVQSELDPSIVYMGWEDLKRYGKGWVDHDFNDLVLCIKLSDPTAVMQSSINHKNNIPRFGTVISEDRKDNHIDSDFNDLNFEYDIVEYGDENNINGVDIKIMLKHRGAALDHNLELQLPGLENVLEMNVKRQTYEDGVLSSVSDEDIFDNTSNRILIVESDKTFMPPNSNVGSGTYTNTRGDWENDLVEPRCVRVKLTFDGPVSRGTIPLLDPPYIVRLIVKKGSKTSHVIKSNVEYDTLAGSKAKNAGIDKIKKIHIIDGWVDFPVPKEKKHLDICYPFFHEYVKNPIRYRNWFLTYRPNTVRGAITRPKITWDSSFDS